MVPRWCWWVRSRWFVPVASLPLGRCWRWPGVGRLQPVAAHCWGVRSAGDGDLDGWLAVPPPSVTVTVKVSVLSAALSVAAAWRVAVGPGERSVLVPMLTQPFVALVAVGQLVPSVSVAVTLPETQPKNDGISRRPSSR